MRRVLLAGAMLVMAGGALGQDEEPYFPFQEDWACGAPIGFDRRLAAEALEHGLSFGFSGSAVVPPFLVGGVRDSGGSYLFVKRQGGWVIQPLFDMPLPEAVYASPAGAVMFVSWHTVEAPGDHVTAYSDDGFATFRCSLLPDGMKYPQYWTLADFNGDGPVATIVGQAMSLDGDLVPPRWSQLTTADGGASWSAPVELSAAPPRAAGVYVPVGPPPIELVEELRAALR